VAAAPPDAEDTPTTAQNAAVVQVNGFAGPAVSRSTERAQAMNPGQARLVRQVQLRLNGRGPAGDDAQWAHAVAELRGRLGRLQKLGAEFAAVRLSGDIAGLRAVSVPDRTGGGRSPGTG